MKADLEGMREAKIKLRNAQSEIKNSNDIIESIITSLTSMNENASEYKKVYNNLEDMREKVENVKKWLREKIEKLKESDIKAGNVLVSFGGIQNAVNSGKKTTTSKPKTTAKTKTSKKATTAKSKTTTKAETSKKKTTTKSKTATKTQTSKKMATTKPKTATKAETSKKTTKAKTTTTKKTKSSKKEAKNLVEENGWFEGLSAGGKNVTILHSEYEIAKKLGKTGGKSLREWVIDHWDSRITGRSEILGVKGVQIWGSTHGGVSWKDMNEAYNRDKNKGKVGTLTFDEYAYVHWNDSPR